MVQRENMTEQPAVIVRAAVFILGLALALLLSLVLVGGGWLLLREPSVNQWLTAQLGITEKSAWYVTRSTGTVAYLLLAGSTIWGLLLSSKIIKESVPAVLSLAMHNVLSWLAFAFTGVHAIALLFDTYYTYTAADLLVPFIGPYRPLAVGLGIIGLYLTFLTSATFYWRKRIGQQWWRRIHYLTFLLFGLVTAHGLMAGTDSGTPGMRWMYLGSTLLVLFLTNYRILAARAQRRTNHSRTQRARA